MAQSKLKIPIICENDRCENCGQLVNLVSEVSLEDLDLFYENYGRPANEEDYCRICGELGVAEDAYWD